MDLLLRAFTLLTAGRLQSTFDRLLVASFAVPLVILQVAWMLFDPAEGHLLLAFPDADVAHGSTGPSAGCSSARAS